MSRIVGLTFLAVILVLAAIPATAQDKEPGRAVVTIYNVAPGKHLDFLKWMAARDAIAKEAGARAGVWYAHTDGASWDYISITPVATPEQDKKIEELTKQKGLTTGAKAALEFRQFISSHTDTYTDGPMSVSDLLSAVEK
jgi:hypothetical protein